MLNGKTPQNYEHSGYSGIKLDLSIDWKKQVEMELQQVPWEVNKTEPNLSVMFLSFNYKTNL